MVVTVASAAPYVSAAAGILGVVVGLCGDLIRRRYSRPRLSVNPFSFDAGDGVYFDHLDPADRIESAWLRLRVHNSGREAAEDVEVFIEGIEERVPVPPGREAFDLQRASLALGRRLKWADRTDRTLTIPRGTSRRIDVAHVITSQPRVTTDPGLVVPIRLTLDHGPSRIHREMLAGLSYRLTLSLSGSNFATSFCDVDLEFGGLWLGASSIDPSHDGALTIVRIAARRSL
jgi:hypothetical protein